MRTITLTKINRTRRYDEDREVEVEVPNTSPVSINIDSIRCFYPRKNNAPGTRITFTDGGGFAVTETYDAVLAMVPPAA